MTCGVKHSVQNLKFNGKIQTGAEQTGTFKMLEAGLGAMM